MWSILTALTLITLASPATSLDYGVETLGPCSGSILCVNDPATAVADSWAVQSKHPLVGKAFRTASLSTAEPLVATIFKTQLAPLSKLEGLLNAPTANEHLFPSGWPIYVLGEIHDNPQHHWARAVIAPKFQKLGSQKPLAWVFEQLNSSQQKAIDDYEAETADPSRMGEASEFKRRVGWAVSGWAQYNYDRLLQAPLDAKGAIYAGDVSRDEIKKAAKQGQESLPAAERARLKLDVPLGDKADAESKAEIEESHCGMLPREALPRMAFAQRYRDAHLADVLLKAAAEHGSAILIAGNGHVRADRGVPWYIRQRAPDKKVVSVMLMEVEEGKNDPEAYVPRDPEGKPAADYIIFTPRAARGDPCEGMRKK